MEEKQLTEILAPKDSSVEIKPFTYFMFSSAPKPLSANLKIGDRRPKFQNNVPKPQGVHHFYNMMWDPRVRRGPTYLTEADRRAEEEARLRRLMTAKLPQREPLLWDSLTPERRQEIKAERHLPAQLRAKRHIALQMELANQLAEASRLRKRARAKRRKEKEEALERAELVRKEKLLANKPQGWEDDLDPNLFAAEKSDSDEEEELDANGRIKPKSKNISLMQSSVDVAEEEYLRKISLVSADSDVELREDEPSLVELDMEDRPSDDSQDEDEVPRQPKWVFPPVPSLNPSMYIENSSQTYPGQFFAFKEKAMNAVGVLLADAIKNSIYELCIEEEEFTMEKHYEAFDRERLEKLEHMAQLQYRTELVTKERLRLEEEDEKELISKMEGREIKREAVFSVSAADSAMYEALKQLETDGFFGDLYLQRIQYQFVPWVNSAVELYTRDHIIGNQLVDEIVGEVIMKRDEELVYANYRQSRTTKSGSVYAAEIRKDRSADSFDESFFN